MYIHINMCIYVYSSARVKLGHVIFFLNVDGLLICIGGPAMNVIMTCPDLLRQSQTLSISASRELRWARILGA